MSLNGSAHLSTTMAVVLQAILELLRFSLISSLKSENVTENQKFQAEERFYTNNSRNMRSEHEKHLAAGLRSVVFDMNFILGENIHFSDFKFTASFEIRERSKIFESGFSHSRYLEILYRCMTPPFFNFRGQVVLSLHSKM